MQRLTPERFFVIRSPLLSFDVLESWTEDGKAHGFSDAWMWETLKRITANLYVRDAIAVASASLSSSLACARVAETDASVDQIWRPLLRYVYRMSARPTPFGLFAGIVTGDVGSTTDLHLQGRDSYETRASPDAELISDHMRRIERSSGYRRRVRLSVNSSLYRFAGQYRYVYIDHDRSLYTLSAVEIDAPIEAIVERARSKPLLIAEAVNDLVAMGADATEAESFIDDLIDQQVLTSPLQLSASGAEFHAQVSAAVRDADDSDERHALETLSRTCLELSGRWRPGSYETAVRSVSNARSSGPAASLHAELRKSGPVPRLSGTVARAIGGAVALLHRCAGPAEIGSSLQRFRERFRDRYGDDEVPLPVAIDPDIGLGFAPDPDPLRRVRSETPSRLAALGALVHDALSSNSIEVALSGDDVEALASPEPTPLPPWMVAHVLLSASSDTAMDRGEFEVALLNCVGPSAGRMLGRFAHSDRRLAAELRRLMDEEQAQAGEQTLICEVTHLGMGRVQNITSRPALRRAEIPYLSATSAESIGIPIEDLLVRVEGAAVKLRSHTLGVDIVPRSSTAYWATNSPFPTYRFLMALQEQHHRCSMSFGWGDLNELPFLPRVRRGRVILHRARWRLDASDLAALGGGDDLDGQVIRRWRDLHRWPRWIALEEMDNSLLVDLDNPFSVRNLVAMLRNRELAIVREMWPTPNRLCVTGPEGRFTSEMMLPLRCGAPPLVESKPTVHRPALRITAPHAFDEWLYLKLYAGPAMVDRLLSSIVEPLVDRLRASSRMDRWFFIRFADPEHHLRLRLRGLSPDRIGLVVSSIEQQLRAMPDGLGVWRILVDRYCPEVERYGGGPAMDDAEIIFCAQSDMVLRSLRVGSAPHSLDVLSPRADMAVREVNRLLSVLGYSPKDIATVLRAAVRENRAAGNFREHERRASRLYRECRVDVDRLVHASSKGTAPSGVPDPVWRRHVIACRRLRHLAETAQLDRPLDAVASSLAHMTVNRWLPDPTLEVEMTIYSIVSKSCWSLSERSVDDSR